MILYASLIVKHVIQIEIGVIKHVNVNVNVIAHAKKIINPSSCICENSKYLESICDTSVIASDEITSALNIVLMKLHLFWKMTMDNIIQQWQYSNKCVNKFER